MLADGGKLAAVAGDLDHFSLRSSALSSVAGTIARPSPAVLISLFLSVARTRAALLRDQRAGGRSFRVVHHADRLGPR